MEASFQLFIDFVELDQRIGQLAAEKNDLMKEREALTLKLDSLKKQTADAYQKFHDLKKSVDLLELELNVLKEKLKEKELKLNQASSPKQFFSLEQEIKDIKEKQSALDEHGINLIEELERAQRKYDELKNAEATDTGLIATQLEEMGKRFEHIELLAHAYQQQKEKEKPLLPQELLERYESMKEKVAKPAVPLQQGSCSACFYAVSHPDLIAIAQGKLITCRDCYRILYIHPKEHAKKES